jgi:hypothetical protein
MQILGHATGGTSTGSPAFAMGFDGSQIVTCVSTVQEARSLPLGSVVGDSCGGLTFSDAVAAALEARSLCGWQDVEASPGDCWTVIVVNR